MKDILEVFPDYLPRIPPKKEKYFGIDLLPDIKTISIPPLQISLAELKQIKSQLKVCSAGVL